MRFNLVANNEENNVEWVSWSQDVKEIGDSFDFEVEKISFKEEPSPAFFLINETEGKGTSVFCTNHPDSKYPNSTPHGIRLVNALGRHLGITGEIDVDDLLAAVELPCTVKVEKTEKGVLWFIV